MSSPFNSRNYYRFFNNVDPNNTMSVGLLYSVNGPVNMTTAQTFTSSENWQIFAQSGLYFIRNYQAGSALQLGLTSDDLSVPRLLNSSGGLGQQWKLSQWTDGKWRITNMLVGNSSVLGIAPGGATVPAMDTSDDDGHWDISINVSAGTISDASLLASVSNVQAAPTSSSTSTSTSTATGTMSTSTSSSTSSGSPSISSSASNHAAKSSGISGGAIAGIVIGVLAVAIIAALASFFFVRRRRQRAGPVQNGQYPGYVQDEKRVPEVAPVEMDAEPRAPPTEISYK